MEERTEFNIVYLHIILGAIAGMVSGSLSSIAFSAGLMIGYSGYILSLIIFRKERAQLTFSKWLGKGFSYFLITWLTIWIMLYNIS